MNADELRKKTAKDLSKHAEDLRKKLSDLRFKFSSNQLKNVKEVSNIKREIARTLTVMKELAHDHAQN